MLLKSELKHEIAKCKHEEGYFMEEREGLNQDKKKTESTEELKQVRGNTERLEHERSVMSGTAHTDC